MKYLIPLLISIVTINHIYSQELSDITTDRPDQSESSSTVPHKTLQIETGFVWQGDKTTTAETRNLDIFNTLFRYGLLNNFELRVGVNYADVNVSPVNGSEDTTLRGFVPLAVGTKIMITKQNGFIPEISMLGTVTVPNTGSKDLDILNLASDFRFALGWAITDRISAGGNIGAQWNTVVPGGSGFYSAVVGISILSWMNGFVELYGWLPEYNLPDHRFDAGLTFPVKKNLQFDVSGGVGLSEISPDYFVNAGVAWRIPR